MTWYTYNFMFILVNEIWIDVIHIQFYVFTRCLVYITMRFSHMDSISIYLCDAKGTTSFFTSVSKTICFNTVHLYLSTLALFFSLKLYLPWTLHLLARDRCLYPAALPFTTAADKKGYNTLERVRKLISSF